MRIPLIYDKLKKEYLEYNMILLNGGFIDLQGANTTTMELGIYDLNYNAFEFNKKHVNKIETNKKERYCILEFKYEYRKINILVTANKELLNKKILKRNNEIMLNNFPLLLAQVLILIKQDYNSFKSWGIVLNMDIEDEESFLIDTVILEKEAKTKTDKINKIILKSNKKIPED